MATVTHTGLTVLAAGGDDFASYTYDMTTDGYTYLLQEAPLRYSGIRIGGYLKLSYKVTRIDATSATFSLGYQSRGSGSSSYWCSYYGLWPYPKIMGIQVYTNSFTSVGGVGIPGFIYAPATVTDFGASHSRTSYHKSGRGLFDYLITDIDANPITSTFQLGTPRVQSSSIDFNLSSIGDVTYNFNIPAWCTLSYNMNGGSGSISSVSGEGGTYKTTITTTKPTRTGYTFKGWSTSSTATSPTYTGGESYTLPNQASVTLYAVWEVVTYTISYNANGGTGAPGNQTKTYGITLTLSSTVPTRAGYNFLGWSTSSTATTATYLAGGSYTTNAAATLYAVWEKAIAQVDVKYNGSWVKGDTYAKYNGEWKEVQEVYVNQNGTWTQI